MIYLIGGIIVFLITATDIIYTVLSSNGAGYLSKYCMRYIAAVFQFTARRIGSRYILKFSGVTLLTSIIIIWISLLWVSVFLILSYDANSVLHSSSSNPATLIDKFYFSGYILSTLGNGDFKPQAGNWQIVTNFFTFSGFIFLTAAITYFLRVISAVTLKRKLAMAIFDLGESADEIAQSFAQLNKGNQLSSEMTNLKNLFNEHTLNHTAFPVTHYFFSVEKQKSISIAVAELYKALALLTNNKSVDETFRVQIESLQTSIGNYLQMLADRFVGKIDKNMEVRGKGLKDENMRAETIKALLKSDAWF